MRKNENNLRLWKNIKRSKLGTIGISENRAEQKIFLIW